MKFYDFIALGLWITSLAFVNISKEFIQGAVTAAVFCGYAVWRIRK